MAAKKPLVLNPTGGSVIGEIPSADWIALTDGGTGATTAAGARTNLGLGSIATQNSGAVAITGGTITGITDLAVADGGTGSSTAAGARSNLGAAASGNNSDITDLNTLLTATWGTNGFILGDWDDTTAYEDRTRICTSGANSSTGIIISANKTSSSNSAINMCATSDLTNSPWMQLVSADTLNYINCFARGTGSAQDFAIMMSGNNVIVIKQSNRRVLINRTAEFDGSGNDLSVNGAIASAQGFRCASGAGGAHGNLFNISWLSNNAQLWIDSTNVGTISLTSDYRVKYGVETLDTDFIDRISKYRVVEFKYDNVGIFKDTGIVQQGLIAHEAQEANPKAATGYKDQVDGDGKIIPQTLEMIPLITDCIGAIQQLINKVELLEAEILKLKGE